MLADPLHVTWLLDGYGSMAISGKRGAEQCHSRCCSRHCAGSRGNQRFSSTCGLIRFSSGMCHLAYREPLLASKFKGSICMREGETELGQAFALMAEEMKRCRGSKRCCAQIVISLRRTGLRMPGRALQAPLNIPWGRRERRPLLSGRSADQEDAAQVRRHPESGACGWRTRSKWVRLIPICVHFGNRHAPRQRTRQAVPRWQRRNDAMHGEDSANTDTLSWLRVKR